MASVIPEFYKEVRAGGYLKTSRVRNARSKSYISRETLITILARTRV